MLKSLLYACVLLLSLGQFSAFATYGSGKLYLFDITIPVFGVTGSLYFLIKKKFSLPRNSVLFFVFILIALFSLIIRISDFDSTDLLSASFYLYRFVFYLVACVVDHNMFMQKMLTWKQFLRVFIYSGVFIAIAGFVQLVVLPDLSILDANLGWDPHKNRLVSVFFDPNYVGGYLCLVLTLMLFSISKFTFNQKLAFTIMLLALFLTYSRSAYGMFGVMIFVYGWSRSPKVLFLSILVALSAYLAVPRIQTRIAGITDPADSARFRLVSWTNTLQVIQDNLWLGVGFNAFKNAQLEYGFIAPDVIGDHSITGSDSSLLLVLATTGVIGFLVFFSGFLIPALTTKNIMILAVTLGLMLESQFINSLFYPQIMFLWLALFCITNYPFSHNLQK